MFIINSGTNTIIVLSYIDDILVISSDATFKKYQQTSITLIKYQ